MRVALLAVIVIALLVGGRPRGAAPSCGPRCSIFPKSSVWNQRVDRLPVAAGYPRQARIVLEALKRYGMMVSDNGSDWYINGAPDPRWSNEQLRAH